MTAPFIHLRCRSTYSLLEGAIRVKELVGKATTHNMPALALTDHGNMFASLDFSLAASGAGIQPIIGCLLNLLPLDKEESRRSTRQPPDQLLVLAATPQGYQNLLKLVSQSFLNPVAGHEAPIITYTELENNTEGLIALTAGIYGGLGKQMILGRQEKAAEMLNYLERLFPNHLYIELMRHGLPDEKKIEKELIALAMARNLPLVATNDIYFADEDTYEAHDALLCIADGRYISETDRHRLTPHHRFKSPAEMTGLFKDVPEAISNTLQISRRCAVMSPARAPILPRFGEDEAELLRIRAREGLQKRLESYVFTEVMDESARETKAKPYRDRLEFELDVIIKMQFPGYFLIVSDFITWSKEQRIPVGPGRGSGAGSVVAWALLITDLDPLRYGLLFERFLNPERVSMPDFDIDFCQDRRDEVIQYVQGKYGRDRVAQIITFGKLQARAVLRDVGRVLQLPYGQVDKICKLVPNNPAAPVTLKEAIDIEPLLKAAIKDDESVSRMVDISLKLEGLNRHASTHAAGVVIGDRPLEQLVPMYRDPKSDMPVVQYSMKYAESAGLVKFDFLGLKTLTVLVKAVEMIRNRGIEVDLSHLPEGDKPTYTMLSQGDTTGVFQLESTGMRDTLKRLKPDCLEDIIALVSLYRPGPMDNIPTYVSRKHGLEKPEYLHPKLEQVLKETYGVIIYQEQVMQIAQLLAGYSLGEADLLRRAMGKKIKAEMEAQRDIFVQRSMERGVEEVQARSIFDLIAKFAEYGFNKSHAAAYAVIAYQTAYLKANYPVEFIAASMTYDMHNTDKLSVFREEASKIGVALLVPDINKSDVYFSVEQGEGEKLSIRYGLAALRNVGAQAMEAVLNERRKNGPFKDVFDFVRRLDSRVINRRQMEFLIKAGVFDSLHKNRAQLFAALDMLIQDSQDSQRERESNQVSLFGGDALLPGTRNDKLPPTDEWQPLEKLNNEFEAVGFYLSAHPLSGYQTVLKRLHVIQADQFQRRIGSAYSQIKVAGIVTGKKIRTSDKGRFAFISMSDATGIFEVAVFNEQLLNTHRDELEEGKLLICTVDAKQDDSGIRLIAQKIAKLEALAEEAMNRPGAMPANIVFELTSPLALHSLKQFLGNPAVNGGTRLRLRAQHSTGTAEILIPGAYQLTPNSLQHILSLDGISNMEEC